MIPMTVKDLNFKIKICLRLSTAWKEWKMLRSTVAKRSSEMLGWLLCRLE
jgi:hypothetical protein